MSRAIDRYLAAWNAGDGRAVVDALTDHGTYEDPTSGGPLSGDALAAYVHDLAAGFPDLCFEAVGIATVGRRSAVVRWVMHGTNTGSCSFGAPTGVAIAIAGADFLEYDPVQDRISSVVGYLDG